MRSWLWKMCSFINLQTGSERSIIYQLAPLVFLRLEELSPNTGLGKSDAIHVVVSPLISLVFFAHSLHSNVPARLNSNFKILLYSFQLLPTIVIFQKFLITFWFAEKMSFFSRENDPHFENFDLNLQVWFPFPQNIHLSSGGDILLHR